MTEPRFRVAFALAALLSLARAGWLLIGVSNQPAAAKAKASVDQLADVQARVLELLAAEGVRFDDFRLCMHHPDGVVPDLVRVESSTSSVPSWRHCAHTMRRGKNTSPQLGHLLPSSTGGSAGSSGTRKYPTSMGTRAMVAVS